MCLLYIDTLVCLTSTKKTTWIWANRAHVHGIELLLNSLHASVEKCIAHVRGMDKVNSVWNTTQSCVNYMAISCSRAGSILEWVCVSTIYSYANVSNTSKHDHTNLGKLCIQSRDHVIAEHTTQLSGGGREMYWYGNMDIWDHLRQFETRMSPMCPTIHTLCGSLKCWLVCLS